ncbi:hypothetical protein UFOVP820_18 [uncultured Caudovirales phage]|uniref:Uncharacterized protein n=1 Tax=uncultured Caudovirales phage TaxID=2100421 RepID=A0A6J5NZQ3_9CAUD|nr:hypothetical protein UFOVP820_18 [uncultured Caudovirales phage]
MDSAILKRVDELHVRKCIDCNGSGVLLDIRFPKKQCYFCNGKGIIRRWETYEYTAKEEEANADRYRYLRLQPWFLSALEKYMGDDVSQWQNTVSNSIDDAVDSLMGDEA